MAAASTIIVLSACGPAGSSRAGSLTDATSASPVGQLPVAAVFGLPFPEGTIAQVGFNRLHDDNFSSLTGTTGQQYSLTGSGPNPASTPPGVPDASLDILAPVGTSVLPLAAGTVLAASPPCQTVLVDHGNGTWVEYVHIKVSVTDGMTVTPMTPLGTVQPELPTGFVPPVGCAGLNSDTPHVHFAFLSGDGQHGQYLSMKGRALCGFPVSPEGVLVGLVSAIQTAFKVPDCGQGGTPSTPSFSVSPGASEPSSTNLASPTPTLAPTARAVVLGGSWVAPANGAKIATSTLTLSAKPTASLSDVTITEVTFSVAWSGGTTTACTAAKAGVSGVWSCVVDLLEAGVPPGKLSFGFDVSDGAGDIVHTPDRSRAVTYAVPPPKPTDISMSTVKVQQNEGEGFETTLKLAWTEPAGYATEFRLYAVFGCPKYSQPNPSQPCLVVHTPLPSSSLLPEATANGTARSLTFKVGTGGVCAGGFFCDGIGAFVLQATNSYGSSVMAIVVTALSKDFSSDFH